jgi:hypothetical protein
MSFSPNLFLSNMRAKGGPAKPSRFEIILPIPIYISNFIGNNIFETILNLPNSIYDDVSNVINNALGEITGAKPGNPSISRYLALQCESTELPGKSLMTHDVKIYGPTFKVPYQTNYDPINFTFICSNEFEERKLFDKWLECIMPTSTNNMRYAKEPSSTYMSDIKIIQYDDFIRQIYAIKLIDAFPIRISSQGLNWGDNNFHRLSVQFAYQKYETIYAGSYDLGNAASMLLGSAAARLLPFG